MDRQPTLSSVSLILRPLGAEDWDGLFSAGSDPAIWALHPVSDRHREPAFRAYFDERLASGGALAVIDRASGRIIGSSSYGSLDEAHNAVEIGWTFLARSHWGGATNGLMKQLMLAHAFAVVDVVTFRIGDHNLRSRRAMEKIGGILTDQVEHIIIADKPVTHVVYAIDKAAFIATGHGKADGT